MIDKYAMVGPSIYPALTKAFYLGQQKTKTFSIPESLDKESTRLMKEICDMHWDLHAAEDDRALLKEAVEKLKEERTALLAERDAQADKIAQDRVTIARLEAERDALREALSSIQIYGLDTLSGRTDGGVDDRAWQREAVNEMAKRARLALTQGEQP